MSRKCPKRNHVFLNWLKENRSRFSFQPRVVRCRKHIVDFEMQGTTNALKFSFISRSCSGISVAAMWHGECLDIIGDFDVAEERSDKGWMCRYDEPEDRQYWQTREQLWIEHCFEPFLKWCNNELATARWLELYIGEGTTAAKLHKDRPATDQHWASLEELVSNLVPVGKPRIEKPATKARYTFIPLRKQLDVE
jgi:hypothetical protein